jgi:hypothetical protein
VAIFDQPRGTDLQSSAPRRNLQQAQGGLPGRNAFTLSGVCADEQASGALGVATIWPLMRVRISCAVAAAVPSPV